MTNTYAPILLFVYNRPEHVRRNIQALLKMSWQPKANCLSIRMRQKMKHHRLP